MGIFSIFKLKQGKSTFLSPKQIVNGVVNLIVAKNNLRPDDFSIVLNIFNTISKDNQKIQFMNFLEYNKFVYNQIICQFDVVIPYYKICGNKPFRDSVIQKEELLKENYRKKAKSFLTNNIYSFPGTNNWKLLLSDFVMEFGI